MTRWQRFLSTVEAKAPAPPDTVAVESDFVVILASLLCALICVVGLFAVARCACLRRRRTAALEANSNAGATHKGLEKKVLESLPKVTYHKDATADAAAAIGSTDAAKFVTTKECAICLGEFSEGDEIRVLPHCGHAFHAGCVDTWLSSHSSCPSCRRVLVVARCQKCGHFPAAAGTQMKAAVVVQHNSSATESNFLP